MRGNGSTSDAESCRENPLLNRSGVGKEGSDLGVYVAQDARLMKPSPLSRLDPNLASLIEGDQSELSLSDRIEL